MTSPNGSINPGEFKIVPNLCRIEGVVLPYKGSYALQLSMIPVDALNWEPSYPGEKYPHPLSWDVLTMDDVRLLSAALNRVVDSYDTVSKL